ncbi:MAG: hypothetical protein HYV07_01895 [Deltaproteobacteria bacterium]|nr:hypothetical protein [Deltaproteobacteria bacterium]
MFRAGIVSSTAALLVGCATTGPIDHDADPGLAEDRALRMNSDSSHVSTVPSPQPVTVPLSKTLAPPDVLAGQLEDQRACMTQVNAIDESYRDRQMAWDLLLACAEKGKVTSFDLIFEDRWRPYVLKLGATETAKLAARLVASRGAKLHGDLPIVQKQGVKVLGLTEALENPSIHKGSLVLLRGRVTEQQAKGAGFVLELDETTEQAIDYYERAWDSGSGTGVDQEGRVLSRDAYGRTYARARSVGVSMSTGRAVTAKAPMPIRGVEVDGEYLFLTKFERKLDPEDELDEQEHVEVSVISVFKPAMDALPLSR